VHGKRSGSWKRWQIRENGFFLALKRRRRRKRSEYASRRSGRGSDVLILRKDKAYQKGFGAACGETA
jgi:hypothetical protein